MEKHRSKTLIALISILIIFGFFYAWRGKLFEKYLNSADILYSQKMAGSALTGYLFADALGEKDNDIDLKIKRAEIFFTESDFVAAEEELVEAMKIDDKNSRVYELLGQINHAEGKYAQAEKYYTDAYRLEPSGRVLAGRVRNMARDGKMTQAKEVLEGEKGKGFDGDIEYYLGLIEINMDNHFSENISKFDDDKYKENIEIISDFFDSYHADDAASADFVLINKANLFNKLGETDFALNDVFTVLARNGKYRDAYLVEGKSFLIDGEYRKSADAFEKCLQLDVNNSEAFFYLEEAYRRMGDEGKAIDYKARYEESVR